MRRVLVYDIEGNGLLDDITEVFCVVCKEIVTGKLVRFYDDLDGIERQSYDYPLRYVIPAIEKSTTIIGHNIIGFDNDIMDRFFGVKTEDKNIVDTLVWSQTLKPDRTLPNGCPPSIKNPVTGKTEKIGPHSLAAWGYRLSHHKPYIDDWRMFTTEILDRCTEDVLIQEKLFFHLAEDEAGFTKEEVQGIMQ